MHYYLSSFLWASSLIYSPVSAAWISPVAPPIIRAEDITPTVTANVDQFRLDPSWNIHAPPKTRVFNWEVSQMYGAPDGVVKPMLVVNSQFPGPLVEANTGDTIVVNLVNGLSEGTSIHWHGMDQNGTVFMDGLVGINQCPIAPGETFQYKFTVREQYGTYWWHSHFSTQYTDGIFGPLIIHSPDDPLKLGVDYDVDQLVIVDDWWHDPAEFIAEQLLTNVTGYDGHGTGAPSPDSGLINGVGLFDCSLSAGRLCTQRQPTEIHVVPGQRVRLRLINSGSHSMQRFSVDEHALQVIEADDTPVSGPSAVHRIPIHNGQRYSLLLDANVGKDGDSYWIRSALVTSCYPWIAKDLDATALAILRYVDEGQAPSQTVPSSTDWSDPTTGGDCIDLDPSTLIPINLQNVPAVVTQSATFNFQLDQALSRFLINGVSYTNHPYAALLYSIYNSEAISAADIATATFNSIAPIDLVINNLDSNIDHPIHLHGRSFWIVAEGAGALTQDGASSVTYNTNNPLRRDVLVVPRASWAVLRLISDDPGVWGIHCHIAFHLAEGFLGAIIIQPETIKSLTPTQAWFNDCASGSPNATAPGKRSAIEE